ncbi:replication/maintenance protein RepL [Oleomonas cavernae]|uniref:replication/maintenance protein RepL n=1 Tax=Oleomonas cavernae TaxID=2320859 RepID=UPI0018F73C3C|nr:replication/maintenance protein RepL [Oleomonas cavernae]
MTPHIDRPQGIDNSRLFAVACIRYFLNVCQRKMALFGGDLELAVIAEAVGLVGIDALLRDPAFKDQFRSLSTLVGAERQIGIKGLGVAEATGLPRETVRRKLKRLVELGIIDRREDGNYILRPGALQGPIYGGLLAELDIETQRFFNECLDEGIYEVTAPADPRP